METYTVKRGDTLAAIVRTWYGDTARLWEVARYNGIQDPNYIQVGQVLKMPPRLEEVKISSQRIGPGTAEPINAMESFYAYDEAGNRYLRVPITSGQTTPALAASTFALPTWVWWALGAGALLWLLNQRQR